MHQLRFAWRACLKPKFWETKRGFAQRIAFIEGFMYDIHPSTHPTLRTFFATSLASWSCSCGGRPLPIGNVFEPSEETELELDGGAPVGCCVRCGLAPTGVGRFGGGGGTPLGGSGRLLPTGYGLCGGGALGP